MKWERFQGICLGLMIALGLLALVAASLLDPVVPSAEDCLAQGRGAECWDR